MRLQAFIHRYGIAILLIFHAVGLVGMTLIDRESFARLTPLNLLLSLSILWLAHPRPTLKLLYVFVGSYLLGYLAELLGTQTGFPFGDYHYGQALGPLLWEVPVIIGVNWFLMLMGSGYLARQIFRKPWLQVMGGALLMTLADLSIEPVAPLLDFWYWQEGSAPLVNYLGWFVVSVIMQLMFQKWLIGQDNPLARPYFLIVVSFFIGLNLLL